MLSLQAKSRQDYEKQVFNFKVEFKRVDYKNDYNPKISIMDGIREVKSVRDFIDLSETSVISLISHKDFHRLNSSAESLNGLFFDFDNGYTIEEFKNTEFGKRYNWIITTSRNHMKVKDEKEACERFHVFIPFDSEIKITDDNRSYIDKVQKHFIKSYVKIGLGLDVDLCAVDLARICFPPFRKGEKIDYDFYEIEFNVSSENIKAKDVIELSKEYIESEELSEKISNEKFKERLKEIAFKKLQVKDNNEFKNWIDLSDDEKLEIILPDLSAVCSTLSHNERFIVASTIYAIKGENGFEIYKSMFDKYEGTGNERNWKQCQKYGNKCEIYIGSLLTYARLNNPDLVKQKEFKNKNTQYQNNLKDFLSKFNTDSKLENITNKETDEVILRDLAEELKSQKIIQHKSEIEKCINKISECETEIIDIDNSPTMEEKSKRQDRKSELKKEIKNFQKIKQSNETELYELNKTNFDSFRETGVQVIQDNENLGLDFTNVNSSFDTDIKFNGQNYLEFFNSFCTMITKDEIIIVKYKDGSIEMKTITQLHNIMQNINCFYKGKNDKIIEKNALDLWLKNINRNQKLKLTFDTQDLSNKNGMTYNMCYKPIIVKSTEKMNERELKLFNTWIYDALCNGDKNAGDYLIEWMRAVIQLKKTKIGIQIMGLQGSGKTTLHEVLSKIISDQYIMIQSDDNFLHSEFNPTLKFKVVMTLEEALFQGDNKGNSKLKDFITGKNIVIRDLFKSPVSLPNPTNFIFLSNHEILTKVTSDDRRYFIIKTNDKYRATKCGKDNEFSRSFYTEFYKFLEEENGAEKIYNTLNEKESDLNWLWENIPMTQKKRENISDSISINDVFIRDLYENNLHFEIVNKNFDDSNQIIDCKNISRKSLYDLYLTMFKNTRYSTPLNTNQFGRFINQFMKNVNKCSQDGKTRVCDFSIKLIETYLLENGIITQKSPTPPTGTDDDTSRSTDSIESLFDVVETKVEKQVSNGNTSKINGVSVSLEDKILKLHSKNMTADEIADMLSCDVKAVEFVLNKGVKPLAVQQEVKPVVKPDVTINVEPKSNLSVENTPMVEPKNETNSEMKDVGNNFTECEIGGVIKKFYKGISLLDDTFDETDEDFISDFCKQYNIKREIRSENQIDSIIALDDTVYETESVIESEKEKFQGVGVIFNNTLDLMFVKDEKLYKHLELENEKGIINVTFDFISEEEFDIKYEHLM